jgi:hypothetical protein
VRPAQLLAAPSSLVAVPRRTAWVFIARKIQLPKALTVLAAGSRLAVSSLQMQTLFPNPLAGLSVLSITAGAGLGVAAVVLAGAMVHYTPVVLLDEPTAYLDLPKWLVFMRLLYLLARQTSKAILLSTHKLDPSLQLPTSCGCYPPQRHCTLARPKTSCSATISRRLWTRMRLPALHPAHAHRTSRAVGGR